MFDVGATEMLLVVIVALLVIGPKDLPLAMRTAGRWMGKVRGMTRHFRSGIDAMIREAEIDEQEKLWADRNAQIMRDHPPEDVMQEGKGAIPDSPETGGVDAPPLSPTTPTPTEPGAADNPDGTQSPDDHR